MITSNKLCLFLWQLIAIHLSANINGSFYSHPSCDFPSSTLCSDYVMFLPAVGETIECWSCKDNLTMQFELSTRHSRSFITSDRNSVMSSIDWYFNWQLPRELHKTCKEIEWIYAPHKLTSHKSILASFVESLSIEVESRSNKILMFVVCDRHNDQNERLRRNPWSLPAEQDSTPQESNPQNRCKTSKQILGWKWPGA